ncbi:hypothetical protein MMC11_004818 [Xylographa trunciseda]|nr:hypothetical protein [Xylographa trunciseda]
MESIINAAKGYVSGSGSQTQSGSEPVSGQTGSGTTEQPYDAGNTTGQTGTTGEALGSSEGTDRSTTAGDSIGAQSSDSGFASRGVNPFIADIAADEKGTTTGVYSGMHAPPQEGSAPSDSAIPTQSRDTDDSTNTLQTGVHDNTTGDATVSQTATSDDATGAQTETSDNTTGAEAGSAGYTSGDKSNQNIQSEVQEPPRPQAEVEDPSRRGPSDDIISEQDKKDTAPEDSSETKEHKAKGETWTGASWVKFDKVNAGDPEISSGKELEDQETAAENAKEAAAPSAADAPAHKEGMKDKLSGGLHMGHHHS